MFLALGFGIMGIVILLLWYFLVFVGILFSVFRCLSPSSFSFLSSALGLRFSFPVD